MVQFLIDVMKKVFKLDGKISCSGDNTMIRVVKTDNAPKPIAPYSQALIAGDFIFVAGQAGVNPATGEVPENVADQTRQALENIKAILEATGTSLDNVVKTTVFLADLTTYNEMNNVYEAYFKGNPRQGQLFRQNLHWTSSRLKLKQ